MEDAQITAIQLFGLSYFSFFLMETTAVDVDATVDATTAVDAVYSGLSFFSSSADAETMAAASSMAWAAVTDADATVDVLVSNPALNKGCPLRAALKYAYDLL